MTEAKRYGFKTGRVPVECNPPFGRARYTCGHEAHKTLTEEELRDLVE